MIEKEISEAKSEQIKALKRQHEHTKNKLRLICNEKFSDKAFLITNNGVEGVPQYLLERMRENYAKQS